MSAAHPLSVLAGLFVASAVALGAPPETKPKATEEPTEKVDTKPIVVPFELLSSRHMAVQVKLNGKGPYRLIFDTGAPMNLINNRIAKDSGVIDPKAKKPALGLFGAMGATPIKSLEVAGAKLENTTAVVIDHPTVALISKALGPIDGIVGFPFFARYRMTVDYQKKELTLVPNGYAPGDYMQSLMQKLMDVQNQSKGPAVVGASGLWGLVVDKGVDDEEAGVDVKEVLADGAAAGAGLKVGDRLLTIDGRWTDSISDTFLAASRVRAGKEVSVVVQRGGKEVKLTAKPAKGL